MCRLFGFRSIVHLPVHHSLREAENALAKQSVNHPDGWGIGYYLDGLPFLHKSAHSAFQDYEFAKMSQVLASETVIAHIRKATVGLPDPTNSHPFGYKKWVFAHNGTVWGFDRIRPQIRDAIPVDLRKCIRGRTDSEHLFHLLLHKLRSRIGDLDDGSANPVAVRDAVVETIRFVDETVSTVESDKVSPLNMLLTNGEVFLAVRRGMPLHYSTQKKACSDYGFCPRATKECLAPLGPAGKINHMILASERITQEDVWEELPDGSILTVSPALDWRIDRLGADGREAAGGIHHARNDRFRNRVIVITGAAHPVARSFADSAAAEGAVVVLIDSDAAELQRTAAHIRIAGGKALPLVADPEDEGSLRDLVDRVAAAAGPADVLVMCRAGNPNPPILAALPAAPGARIVFVGENPELPRSHAGWARANAVGGVQEDADPARVSPVLMFLASEESALLDGVVLPCGLPTNGLPTSD
jgi:glutamine amidotransferase